MAPRHESDERTLDEQFGFAAGTIALVRDIERVANRVGMAQKQQALASALWRTVAQHPSFLLTADFCVEQLVLRQGGRDLSAEVRMFPERFPPGDRGDWPRMVERLGTTPPSPTVPWHGSVGDLVTDLLPLLGVEQLERLAVEAKERVAKERRAQEGYGEGGPGDRGPG